jgi:hypothetical protein
MRPRRRRWMLSLRHRDSDRWTDRQAAMLMSVVAVLMVAVPVAILVRYARSTDRTAWPFTVPWNPSWPSLPEVSAVRALSVELAQKVYALVAVNEETLQYIPCYCGCRDEGHGSVLHCHVKRRSADGRVAEWNEHGRICPMGADISGDAVFWRRQGTPLARVRADIEREYSSRGPATSTPPVPAH